MQKHPWFRKGLPESLDVDAYNSHFVELSKTPDIVESREAIKKVMQVIELPFPGQASTAEAWQQSAAQCGRQICGFKLISTGATMYIEAHAAEQASPRKNSGQGWASVLV